MYMYQKGSKIPVETDKSQVETLKEAGWTTEAKVVEKEQPKVVPTTATKK